MQILILTQTGEPSQLLSTLQERRQTFLVGGAKFINGCSLDMFYGCERTPTRARKPDQSQTGHLDKYLELMFVLGSDSDTSARQLFLVYSKTTRFETLKSALITALIF
ncbi:hypothetical protein NL108_013278 [Boleophthalmus pectinirostris]|nr:hypothetical protein NL108_013278 [Boleophthalmus pectinirostris]